MLASTFPNLKSYDPAFAYELAVIVRDGIRRMYQEGENIFYYITLYNENYSMPPMPEGPQVEEGIIKGAYCARPAAAAGEAVHLLASGSMMQQAMEAADVLEALGYAPAIWSVTSYIELAREAEQCERDGRLQPFGEGRRPYIENLFAGVTAPIIAVSDYQKSLAGMIARWMPPQFAVLGTDGFGVSESRPALRDHFEVSARHIVQAVLVSLYRGGAIDETTLRSQIDELGVDASKPDPALR